MESYDDFDEAIFVLKSRDGTLELRMELLKPPGKWHDEWISYRIIFSRLGIVEFVFESTDDYLLFLNAFEDPEVPKICSGIRNAVEERNCFEFEPMDEGDFLLKVDARNQYPQISIRFRDVSPEGIDQWNHGVEVTRSDLNHFVSELETRYLELSM